MLLKTKACFSIGFLATWLLTTTGLVYSHGGIKHNDEEAVKQASKRQGNEEKAFIKINLQYKKEIRPIFERSCFDCHSDQTRYPWYHELPVIGKIIDEDINEAREHLDFSNDFPFIGHGSPESDLKEIKKSVMSGEMPPFEYKLLHWRASLSQDEKEAIAKWVADSLERLDSNSSDFK